MALFSVSNKTQPKYEMNQLKIIQTVASLYKASMRWVVMFTFAACRFIRSPKSAVVHIKSQCLAHRAPTRFKMLVSEINILFLKMCPSESTTHGTLEDKFDIHYEPPRR